MSESCYATLTFTLATRPRPTATTSPCPLGYIGNPTARCTNFCLTTHIWCGTSVPGKQAIQATAGTHTHITSLKCTVYRGSRAADSRKARGAARETSNRRRRGKSHRPVVSQSSTALATACPAGGTTNSAHPVVAWNSANRVLMMKLREWRQCLWHWRPATPFVSTEQSEENVATKFSWVKHRKWLSGWARAAS
jgi:hypothetical protein